MPKNPVVVTAKEKAKVVNKEPVLSTGYRVRICPVSAQLVMDVQGKIPYPPVPIIVDEEKGQTYENPNHPDYIRKVQEVDSARAMAAMDAITFFGVELVDGLPDDDKWLRKLMTLDKANGTIGLDRFDLDDEYDLEFLFKKFIVVGAEDFDLISDLAGVSEEGITESEDSFPGDS